MVPFSFFVAAVILNSCRACNSQRLTILQLQLGSFANLFDLACHEVQRLKFNI